MWFFNEELSVAGDGNRDGVSFIPTIVIYTCGDKSARCEDDRCDGAALNCGYRYSG